MLEQIINTLETVKVSGQHTLTLLNCINALEQVKELPKDDENYLPALKNIFEALMTIETSGKSSLGAMAGVLQAFSQLIEDAQPKEEPQDAEVVEEND